MKTNNVIDEIVKSKKERFNSLGIKEDLTYLLIDSNFQYWNSYKITQPDFWIDNFKKFVTDKPMIQGIVKIKDTDYDSYFIELDICSFRIEVTKKFRGSFVDSDTSYGDFLFYHNDELVCELGMNTYRHEYGSTTSISDVEGFIDGNWVNDLKVLITRLKKFNSVISGIYEQIEEDKRNEELKVKFGISESEIVKFKKNTTKLNESDNQKTLGYYFGFGLVRTLDFFRKNKFIVYFVSLLILVYLTST